MISIRKRSDDRWAQEHIDSLEQIFLNSDLLTFMVKYLKAEERYLLGKTFLVFSKKETALLDEIASNFLPLTGDRPAIFLESVLLTNLRRMYAIGFSAIYMHEVLDVPVTEAKEGQLRLAISIGK